MIAASLASYAITGTRPLWPLLVVVGLLLLFVVGLLIAQFTDPERRDRGAEATDVDTPPRERKTD